MLRDPSESPEPPGPRTPADARVGRLQQAATTVALVAGFVFHLDWLLPIWTLVLAVDLGLGPHVGPVAVVYRFVARERATRPTVTHPPARMRANALPEVVVLLVGSGLFALGITSLAWVLGLLVAVAAAYSAVSDACVGCEMTRRTRRLR